MSHAGWLVGLIAIAGVTETRAETPTLGVSVIAAEARIGDAPAMIIGGQLAAAWSINRFTLTGEGSLLDLPEGAESRGRSLWIGASGRMRLFDAQRMSDDRDATVRLAMDSELVAQREYWRVDESAGDATFERTAWGLGVGCSVRFASTRSPGWIYDTRVFVRLLRSERADPELSARSAEPMSSGRTRETLVLFGFGIAFGANTALW